MPSPSGVLVSNPAGPPSTIWSATSPRSVSVPIVWASSAVWLQAITCLTSPVPAELTTSVVGSRLLITAT